METRNDLSSGGFMAALSSDERLALTKLGRHRRFGPGTTFLAEGDPSDHLLLITKGRVKVWRSTEDGREVVLALGDAGDLYGEVAGLDGQSRSASVSAVGPVEAVVISSSAFRSLLSDHPRIGLIILSVVSRRLRDADQIRTEFGGHDALRRVASRLLELVRRFGETTPDGVHIGLPISQRDLAGWTGSSRESVNKVLTTMRKQGWIRTHRRGITVTDPEALSRCAS